MESAQRKRPQEQEGAARDDQPRDRLQREGDPARARMKDKVAPTPTKSATKALVCTSAARQNRTITMPEQQCHDDSQYKAPWWSLLPSHRPLRRPLSPDLLDLEGEGRRQ